jgi:hypothetical protein
MEVVSLGLVPKTARPEPVSSVRALAKLALEGVARNVATPDPRPETPVEIGRPVALVRVTAEGVPRLGVVKTGEVVIATLPVPLTVYSPSTPALLKSTFVSVPDVIAVVPTTRELLPVPQSAPVPEITPELFTWRHWVEPVIPERVVVPERVVPEIVGLVPNTNAPLPVSSLITPAS